MVTYTKSSASRRSPLFRVGTHPLARRGRPTSAILLSVLLLLPALLDAAVSDAIIWDSIRTTTELKNTLANGYASTAGMRLWWKLANPGNLQLDSTGNGHSAKIKGVVQGVPITDEFGV
jgi:hypothetical protein